MMATAPTIDAFLEQVATFVDNGYGTMVRGRFQDTRGASELAMLVSPKKEELDELRRAVAIMTARERAEAAELSEEQVQRIAEDAHVDAANLAIFFNGYALHCKRLP